MKTLLLVLLLTFAMGACHINNSRPEACVEAGGTGRWKFQGIDLLCESHDRAGIRISDPVDWHGTRLVPLEPGRKGGTKIDPESPLPVVAPDR